MTKFVELKWKIPPDQICIDGVQADRWTEVIFHFLSEFNPGVSTNGNGINQAFFYRFSLN